jgi:hypothetical protein
MRTAPQGEAILPREATNWYGGGDQALPSLATVIEAVLPIDDETPPVEKLIERFVDDSLELYLIVSDALAAALPVDEESDRPTSGA